MGADFCLRRQKRREYSVPRNSDYWSQSQSEPFSEQQCHDLVMDLLYGIPDDALRHPIVIDKLPLLTHYDRGLEILIRAEVAQVAQGVQPAALEQNANARRLLLESLVYIGYSQGLRDKEVMLGLKSSWRDGLGGEEDDDSPE